MYEKNTKKIRLSITPTSILSNRLPSTAKQKNKMYKGAKKEAHPCVMSNVTNCVEYLYYSAPLLLCRLTITKYTYEVRKAEGALLQKLNVLRMELLNVASLDLDLVDVRSCLVRYIRVTIPRSNNDMEGPPSYPPRSNPRNANVAFYCRKRALSPFSSSSRSASLTESGERRKRKRTASPPRECVKGRCSCSSCTHSTKMLKKNENSNKADTQINMEALYRISEIKVTGSDSGTAEEARTKTAPLLLAKKDVQKGPMSKLTGSGSGIAGDAPMKSAPLQINLGNRRRPIWVAS